MTLIEHAEHELALAGYFKEGDDMELNLMMAHDVKELIKVFAEQGHSGMSAPFAISLFKTLASYKLLSPLTGEQDEWVDVSAISNEPPGTKFQNKRASHVFKENGKAYDIDAIIFKDENGATFTSRDSAQPVTFPYMPKSEVRPAPKEDASDASDTPPTPGPLSASPSKESKG